MTRPTPDPDRGSFPRGSTSPTVQLLVAFLAVFLLERLGGLVGVGEGFFALALPLASRPWTLVTSVYAHGSLGHLLANAVALALIGLVLERSTTPGRFHAFVLATGALSGVAEVVVAAFLGAPTAVLGASGAILALYGYALAGNPLTEGLLARVDLGRRGKAVLIAGVVVAVVIVTGGPGAALVAHATGFALGVVSGRIRLLAVR